MSIWCHASICQPFSLAELQAETPVVLSQLLTVESPAVRLTAGEIDRERGWIDKHVLDVHALQATTTATPFADYKVELTGLATRTGTLAFGDWEIREDPTCFVMPRRTVVGVVTSMAICLAAARLGRGVYYDEMYLDPIPTLSGLPDDIIEAVGLSGDDPLDFVAACHKFLYSLGGTEGWTLPLVDDV